MEVLSQQQRIPVVGGPGAPGRPDVAPSALSLDDVSFAYGDVSAVRSIDLNVGPGEFVSLLGPSGSGKTTVLRLIGGYVRPTGGRIGIGGVDVTTRTVRDRNIGMVFQQYALFPHLTAFDNVAFGLKVRRIGRADIKKRVAAAFEMVGLEGIQGRLPKELSGGQQQRVALARAIVIRPALLLLDEPLAALDARLRDRLQIEIRRIQQDLGITTVYVTHDQNEAFSMSDRVAIMHNGVIAEIGAPEEIYRHPKSAYAARFIGQSNVLPIDVKRWGGNAGVVTLRGEPTGVEFQALGQPPATDRRHCIAVRADAVACSPEQGGACLKGTVTSRRFLGLNVLLTVAGDGWEMLATDRDAHHRPGDVVFVTWDPKDATLVTESDDVDAEDDTTDLGLGRRDQ